MNVNKAKYFDSAYPGSMSEREDGSYVEKSDSETLADALLKNLYAAQREAEDWKDAAIHLEKRIKDIGDFAHDRSKGPAIEDDLWEVRRMAYGL
jgi:hypothetical protein